jgi:hypothetical protein
LRIPSTPFEISDFSNESSTIIHFQSGLEVRPPSKIKRKFEVFYLHYFILFRAASKYAYNPELEGKKLIINKFHDDFVWVYDGIELFEVHPLKFVFSF